MNDEKEKSTKNLKSLIIKALIAVAIGFLITLAVFFLNGIFNATTLIEIFKKLSDGFFVPAVLLIGGGLLVFCSNEGTFDMLIFGAGRLFSVFIPNPNRKSYLEFKESRKDKKREFLYLILAGAVHLLLSIIFFLLYLILN